MEPLLHLADARLEALEPLPVSRADGAAEPPRFVDGGVEDAATLGEATATLGHLLGRAGHEQPLVDPRRPIFGGHEHAVARPGEAAVDLVDVDAEVERWESRLVADRCRGELIERDGVAKSTPGRPARGGEKTVLRRMPPPDPRMGEATDDGEVVAPAGERLEERREGIARACLPGEERLREDAEVVHDEERPTWRPCVAGPAREGVEPGKRDRHASPAKHRPPRQSPERQATHGNAPAG